MSHLKQRLLIRDIANALKFLRSAHRRSGNATFRQAADLIAPHLEATTDTHAQAHRELSAARDQVYARLSPREREFLHLDADGLNAEEVSLHLGIRSSTVYRYRSDFKARFFCATLGELQRHIRKKRDAEE